MKHGGEEDTEDKFNDSGAFFPARIAKCIEHRSERCCTRSPMVLMFNDCRSSRRRRIILGPDNRNRSIKHDVPQN